jgi:beta-mannosidase
MSWSVIDYDLIAKAGYSFVQRSYRPVLRSFVHAEDGRLSLWVTNSTPKPLELRVEIATFAGKRLADETIPATFGANESREVWSADSDATSLGTDRYAWVSERAGLIEPNRMFFAPLKDVEFGHGQLESRVVSAQASTATVEQRASGFCYLSRIAAPAAGVSFSTNYHDLRDGDSATIQVTGLPEGFDPTQLRIDRYAGQDRRRRDSACHAPLAWSILSRSSDVVARHGDAVPPACRPPPVRVRRCLEG